MNYFAKVLLSILFLSSTPQVSYSQKPVKIQTQLSSNYELLPNTSIPYINVEFVGKGNLTIKKAPKFNSKNPFYGKVTLGNAVRRQTIIIILDEKAGQKSRIFIDTNNNGNLTDDGEPFWTNSDKNVWSKQVSIDAFFNENGGNNKVELPFRVLRFENPTTNQIRLVLRPEFLREGKLILENRTFRVLAQTYNTQGLFSDINDITLGIDRNEDGIIDKSLLSAEIYWGGRYGSKPFNIGGETFSVNESSASGDEITITVSKNKVAEKNYVSIGKSAPEFSFKDIAGNQVSLENLKNKVILLDFWATWCVPCVRNLPKLKKLTDKYPNDDFAIIGISMDGGRTNDLTLAEFKKFLEHQTLDWQTSFENLGMESKIAEKYNIVDVPLYIVIDREGYIQAIERGGRDEAMNQITDTIQKLFDK